MSLVWIERKDDSFGMISYEVHHIDGLIAHVFEPETLDTWVTKDVTEVMAKALANYLGATYEPPTNSPTRKLEVIK